MPTEVGTPNNWLIVGLGNPGVEYAATRHNLGFMVVDRLAREVHAPFRREECGAVIARAMIGGQTVEFAKPLMYMNRSGEPLRCLLSKNERSVEKLIVISDDLALPLGQIRIRTRGGHGGQKGLKSIIDYLGGDEFIRLRIGIASDHPVADAKNFVLDRFSKTETETLEKVLEESANAIVTIVSEGPGRAMARFN